MRKLVALGVAALVLAFAAPASAQWYSGGTLHHSTVAQWRQASASNRLATASDWVAAVVDESQWRTIGMDGLRQLSEALVSCVDQASTAPAIQGSRASELAAACVVLMGWIE